MITEQEFEIIKDHDLAHGEIIARSKIKWFNKRGYICTSQSITTPIITRDGGNVGGEWVISLLFSPISDSMPEGGGEEERISTIDSDPHYFGKPFGVK